MIEKQNSYSNYIYYDSNNEESSDSIEAKIKKFKFRKFKSKYNNKKEKDIKDIEDAENKVISLLSDYLKNIKLENKKENPNNVGLNQKFSLFNQNQNKKNKRKVSQNIINVKNIFGNNKYLDSNYNINNPNKNDNIFSTSISPKMNKKKKSKKENPLNNNKLYNSNSSKIVGTFIFPENNKNHQSYISKSFRKSKDKVCEEQKYEMKNNKDSNKSENIKSSTNSNEISDVNGINYNSIDRNQTKEKKNEILNKLINNQDKKSRNFIFNESFHNSMISEGSEYNINQKSFEIKSENKSKINSSINICTINNRLALNSPNKNSQKNKRNTMEISQRKYKNLINKKPSKFKRNNNNRNNINNKKKESRKKSEDRSEFINNKFFRRNADFKSIKEKLKDLIILRPEDSPSSKRNTKSNNTNLSNNKLYLKRTNQTDVKNINLRNINKTINRINLGYINKDELIKKNNSDINNSNYIHFPQISPEKNDTKKEKIEQNKNTNNNENESEQTLKTTKTNKINKIEISKNPLRVFANNALQRKNTLYFEKLRKISRKPNIYDSLDDEELEDEEEESIIYLDPNSYFMFFFDGILFLLSIISFIQTPLYLAITHDFCKEKKLTFVSSIHLTIEFFYICDLFLGFFRAYYNWEEQLICKHKNIIKKYMTGWFIFDLISAIPIYFILILNEPYCNDYELSTKYYNIILDKINYCLIVNKLIKLVKVLINNQAIKVISNKINDEYKVIFYVFLALSALNYTACLYIFIARNCYPNWILKTGLGTHSFVYIYICSIYIIIMALTTVGYGDITCYSFNERIYQLFLLIVGIIAYSYAVTSISNYIQKINEQSTDFTKKKSILDEIKLSNPNLPDDLYERILKHLSYKHKNEKKLKNLVFDCLPVTLKNDLIYEMYKPIITNFLFFKNYHNKDFIVSVILAFKAIIAFKNDILVNEGDMIEDIIFVKKGILSVELPINITNPQKNIDKYLNTSLLEADYSQNLENKGNNMDFLWEKDKNLINVNNKYISKDKKGSIPSVNLKGTDIESSKLYTSLICTKSFFQEKEKSNVPEEIKYVRIVRIRKNEHFGDLLIFLEKRSPLRLRARTKKCELFFLKKMDAINISNKHPNIWRNINKKSIYNFEQIKKCIVNIVEIYCSVKKEKNKKESLFNMNKKIKNKTSKRKKKKNINGKKKKDDLKYSTLSPIKEINIKRSNSLIYSSNSYFKNLFKKKKIDINFEEYKNQHKYNKYLSFTKKEEKSNFDELYTNKFQLEFSSSSSSRLNKIKKNTNFKDKKSKHSYEQKMLDAYNGNYKFYQGIGIQKFNSQKLRKVKTIEKSENAVNDKKNKINSFYSQKQDNKNTLIRKNIINNHNLINSPSSKTLKIDKSYSYHLFKEEYNELIEDKDENESDITSSQISKEMHSGEEIKLSKETHLFSKKYMNDSPNYKLNNLFNNNIEYKNAKIKFLLNSFKKESNLINEKNKSSSNVSLDNNNINIISNTKINTQLNSHYNDKNEKEKIFKNCILSIDNTFSLLYESSYENCNLLCKEKLINNKSLQDKLKTFLTNEIIEPRSNSNFRKNNNTLIDSNNKDSSISKYQTSLIQKEKNENSIVNNTCNSPLINKFNRKLYPKTRIILDSNKENHFLKKRLIRRSSSFNHFYFTKNKKIFNDEINNDNTLIKKRIPHKKTFISNKDFINPFSNEVIHKKLISKKTAKNLSPQLKIKNKKSSNLLLQIDFNIEKTNQNLNNPDQFYNNFFNYLLEEKIKGKENKKYNFSGSPMNDDIEFKKEKLIKKRMTVKKNDK